ncbi:MAG: SRPBCC family protein, partial [Mycobacteriaceae bacterium]|nr:SRPBCC family protein [Mycobacteriaceae bacterium]
PGREFGFDVLLGDKPTNHWHYSFAARDGGTDVTESFRLAPTPVLRFYWAVLGPLRGRRNVRDMRRTLERIKDVVESA